jgi:DNA-binding transcriptional LysR family regulator
VGAVALRNIPTDLLRTFLAVIDLRSHTRAAEQLGRTQPAISLQMKKLQELLDVSLFAKDAGAQPTEAGELVASYARQMLTLNDEMVLRLSRRDHHGKIRLGIPNDYADHFLPKLMPQLARHGHDFRFEVVCDLSHALLQGLRNGLYDMVVAMTPDGPAEGAFMTWKEPLVWIGETKTSVVTDASSNLRVVCFPEGCLYRRAMLTALQRDGRGYELVYTSPSLSGLEAAIGSGYGNTVLARRIVPAKLATLDDVSGLPRLADVVVGIYLSSDRKRSLVAESFAAHFADAFVASNREGDGA